MKQGLIIARYALRGKNGSSLELVKATLKELFTSQPRLFSLKKILKEVKNKEIENEAEGLKIIDKFTKEDYKNFCLSFANLLVLAPWEVEESLEITRGERLKWQKYNQLSVERYQPFKYGTYPVYNCLEIAKITKEKIESWRNKLAKEKECERQKAAQEKKDKKLEVLAKLNQAKKIDKKAGEILELTYWLGHAIYFKTIYEEKNQEQNKIKIYQELILEALSILLENGAEYLEIIPQINLSTQKKPVTREKLNKFNPSTTKSYCQIVEYEPGEAQFYLTNFSLTNNYDSSRDVGIKINLKTFQQSYNFYFKKNNLFLTPNNLDTLKEIKKINEYLFTKTEVKKAFKNIKYKLEKPDNIKINSLINQGKAKSQKNQEKFKNIAKRSEDLKKIEVIFSPKWEGEELNILTSLKNYWQEKKTNLTTAELLNKIQWGLLDYVEIKQGQFIPDEPKYKQFYLWRGISKIWEQNKLENILGKSPHDLRLAELKKIRPKITEEELIKIIDLNLINTLNSELIKKIQSQLLTVAVIPEKITSYPEYKHSYVEKAIKREFSREYLVNFILNLYPEIYPVTFNFNSIYQGWKINYSPKHGFKVSQERGGNQKPILIEGKNLKEVREIIEQGNFPKTEESNLFTGDHPALFFDGSFLPHNNNLAAAAAIIYNENEEIKVGEVYTNLNNSLEAEFWGLIIGLEKAKELGLKSLSIYGDCLSVIQAVLHKQIKEDYQSLWSRAIALLKTLDNYTIKKVSRENNKIAHEHCKTTLNDWV